MTGGACPLQQELSSIVALAHHKIGRQQGLHLALAAVGLPDREGHVEAVVLMPRQQHPPL